MSYIQLNLVLGVVAVSATAACLRRASDLRRALRVSSLLTCIGYPWDFLALELGIWSHSKPGPTLYSVPLNDLLIVFSMSMITSSLLLRLFPDVLRQPGDQAEGKSRD